MALSEQEFEELRSLIGGSQTPVEPVAAPKSAGGGRGSYLTGITNPLQYIAAQRAAEAQQTQAKEKAALEREGFLSFTGRKAKETLFGLGDGQGTIGQNLATGILRRTGVLSEEAQQYYDAQQRTAEREKQIEQEIAQMEGRETGFIPRVSQNIANVARYAVAEPKLFGSQIVSSMADPAQLLLGGVGVPVRGAGLVSNIARTAGGGAFAGGVTAGARTFGQGDLDVEQAAEEAATGGVLSAGIYGAGRTARAVGEVVTQPVIAIKDIVSPLKQSIPKPIAELIATNNDIANTFNEVAQLKKFYGSDFKPNLAEITKEIAVIDKANLAAKNDVNAILTLRSNRSATEDAFIAKLNSAFPASDNVLDTLGKDIAKKSHIEQSVISAQEDALVKQTAKFKEMGGQSPLELGASARELRDLIKVDKKKYWDGIFTNIKNEGDNKKISMSPDNVETLYTATKNIPVSVFESFDPVTQKAIRELNRYIEVQETPGFSMLDAEGRPMQVSQATVKTVYDKVPFSVLHDYSNAINREYSNVYTAASMGNADARVMLNQVKAAKTALDNGLSTLPGKFGVMYKETKAKYGSDFMGLFYEGFGGQLRKRNRFGESIQDSDVAAKLISKPEYINDFIRLNDNSPLAQQAVTEALIQKFMKTDSVMNADGSIKQDKLNSFISSNTDAFNFVPSARDSFKNLQNRIQSYVESKGAAELRKADIADAATAQLLKKTRLEDVFNTNESGAFAKPDMLTKLLKASEKDKTGAETSGIQRAMIDAAQKQSNPSEFVSKNKALFDKAFTGKQADNLNMILKGIDLLDTKLNVNPGEKIVNYKGLAGQAVVAGGLGFISPFLSAGYIGLSMLVGRLKARKERIENAAFVNVLTNPEASRDLLVNLNKAKAAIASGNAKNIDTALGALKQTLINNGVDVGFEQQTEGVALPEDTQPVQQIQEPTQPQGPAQELSPDEFEELKKLQLNVPQKERVSSIIEDEAAKLGIPEHIELLVKLAKQESGYKQGAISPKGAIGVMQLMPATAQELGVNPNDLDQNVRGGVRYWAKMLKFFNNDVKLATAAYNAGPGNVIKAGNKVPEFKETQDYVAKIAG